MKEVQIEIFNENLVTEIEPTFNIPFDDIIDLTGPLDT